MTSWNGPSQPYAGPPEPVLVGIGDIACTQSQVFTPSGSAPVGQVQWYLYDQTRAERRIPPWAIVVAVIGALLCLLGLLFLLVKETVVVGQIQVTVQGPGFQHTAYVPIDGEAQRQDAYARVDYARALAAGIR